MVLLVSELNTLMLLRKVEVPIKRALVSLPQEPTSRDAISKSIICGFGRKWEVATRTS
jgi:hypothetical protein